MASLLLLLPRVSGDRLAFQDCSIQNGDSGSGLLWCRIADGASALALVGEDLGPFGGASRLTVGLQLLIGRASRHVTNPNGLGRVDLLLLALALAPALAAEALAKAPM